MSELLDRATPLLVGEVLQQRLERDDLMRIFNLKSLSYFYELRNAGKFDRFVLKPRIGRVAWSGKLVQAYLAGEDVPIRRRVLHAKPRLLEKAG